ncbi:flagellar hook-associated protein FlgK [Pseudothermotoga sp. U03pept]|uniref:flagellar hook-associated protein FlgK n=1 Tax=Pseudothermotoga sp. U03pept TaxID=3447012 RepID=UPI003F07FA22
MANLSLFGSLNTALMGVYTHKLAMNVVGHNIANASTEGYSRQRPMIVTTHPLTIQLGNVLTIGTGSMVKDIQRVRDLFLDLQYRQVTNRYSYFDTTFSNLHYIEQLLTGTTDSGITSLYDNFLSTAEEVITDPTNVAAKREFITSAQQMVTNMKDLYKRLQELREDINQEINQTVDKINSLVERLAKLNEQIRIALALKSTPNDLLDERDRILDELSQYANISHYETKDGQTILMLGDQVVLSGSVQTQIRALERPYAKGFYELFVGDSRVSIADGKLKALLDLRDNTVVKYMSYLDEFALTLTDKLNLIHREGFDASGKISGLNLFNPITPLRSAEDPALYRILSSRKIMNGPIYYTTGLTGYSNQSQLESITFVSGGSLTLFDGTDYQTVDVANGSTVNDLISSLSTTWFSLQIGEHSPTAGSTSYRLYFDSSINLRDALIIDTGNILTRMGFATKEVQLLTISGFRTISDSDSDLPIVTPGDYTLTFQEKLSDGTEFSETLNLVITEGLEWPDLLPDLMNQINSQLTNIRAAVVNNSLVLIPKSNLEFNNDRVSITDSGGFLVQAKTTKVTYSALALADTLENVFASTTNFDPENGFDLLINNTSIHVDPTTDTLTDFVKKINSANTGVVADLTPHGGFVLRASRSYDFDLRSFNISGPQGLFEALGFVDTNNDPTNFDADWNTLYTLISRNEDFETVRDRLSLSELLTVDRRESYEPYFFVDQWAVTNALLSNAESLAIDIGKTLLNTTWNAINFVPTGASNVEIMNLISSSRYDTLLADGKENFYEFMTGIIAELGVESETASKMKDNTELLRSEIEQARESVKGVSLDEEMANMIKYQHAFSAAARVITAVDEMIGRVIDKLGVVGR